MQTILSPLTFEIGGHDPPAPPVPTPLHIGDVQSEVSGGVHTAGPNSQVSAANIFQ